MPPLARLYVRTAFVYFVAAFALDTLMMLDRWFNFSQWLKAVYFGQVHLLTVGWITQLAIGVAYWIFPRFLKEQHPRPRGSDALTWAVFVCLNGGLILRFLLEPFDLMRPQPWLAAVITVSGVLQAAAALGFAWLIWGRIRALEQ